MDNRKRSFVMAITSDYPEHPRLVVYPGYKDSPDDFADLVSVIGQALGADDPKDLVIEIEGSYADKITQGLDRRGVPYTVLKEELARHKEAAMRENRPKPEPLIA